MDYEHEKLELDHKIFEAKIALKRVEDAIDYLVRKREVLEEANQFYPELFGGDIEARSKAQDDENLKTYWLSNEEQRREIVERLTDAERSRAEKDQRITDNLARMRQEAAAGKVVGPEPWYIDEKGNPRLERHRNIGHDHGI